jgi:alpha-tubulin suppressor-like RCC1 family protein
MELAENEIIKRMSGGGNHSAFITESGQLYMSGFSQLGEEYMKTLAALSETEQKEWTTFTKRYNHIKWRDVACGWAFTILLADSGKLYGMGSSQWNELAGPSSKELVNIGNATLDNIISIACGWRHTIALDKEGIVYGWGCGRHGQLGPSIIPPTDKKDIRTIQKIQMPQSIVQIACGHLHTLLRGKDGTVYGFGSNKYGQLKQVKEDTIVHKDSIYIDAGWHHSASLNENGDLDLWGRNDHGQLSDQNISDIKSFACGSEHAIAITNFGNIKLWGWNEHGNCTTDKKYVEIPIQLELSQSAYIVGAGCATSWYCV